MKMAKKKILREGISNLKRAIKLKCYDCNNGQKKMDCLIDDCPLYPFRPFKEKTK